MWLRPGKTGKKSDSNEYYEWVLIYVEDILAISVDPTAILKGIEGDTVKRMTRLKHQKCTLEPSFRRRRSIDTLVGPSSALIISRLRHKL